MENQNVVFIGDEEKEVLNDILSKCMFMNSKDKRNFWKQVLGSVQAPSLHAVTEDDFETAFNTAKSILHKIGDEILSGKGLKASLQSIKYIQGARRNGAWF